MADILDEVDAATRATLVRYGFDPDRFAALQEAVRTGRISAAGNVLRGQIEPPPEELIARLPEPHEPALGEAYALGVATIRRGEVAMAVLNGGMATRFGGAVKGIVEAVGGRSFLEWKLADAAHAARAAGGRIPAAVMNSFATDEPTRSFLAGMGERSEDLPELLFFTQFVSMRLETDGSVWRDVEGRPSLYGPGHGDFAEALRVSGTLEALRRRGVR